MVKKSVDKWRTKKWYDVVAPNFMNNAKIGKIPIADPEKLVNRILRVPLKDITKNIKHLYSIIKLRIYEVRGKTAFTKFIGFEILPQYLRTFVRRRMNIIETVVPAKAKGGERITFKCIAYTVGKQSKEKRSAVVRKLREYLSERAKNTEFGRLIEDVVWGKVSKEIEAMVKRIVPVKKVEIYKLVLKEEFDIEEKEKAGQEGDSQPEAKETTA